MRTVKQVSDEINQLYEEREKLIKESVQVPNMDELLELGRKSKEAQKASVAAYNQYSDLNNVQMNLNWDLENLITDSLEKAGFEDYIYQSPLRDKINEILEGEINEGK